MEDEIIVSKNCPKYRCKQDSDRKSFLVDAIHGQTTRLNRFIGLKPSFLQYTDTKLGCQFTH